MYVEPQYPNSSAAQTEDEKKNRVEASRKTLVTAQQASHRRCGRPTNKNTHDKDTIHLKIRRSLGVAPRYHCLSQLSSEPTHAADRYRVQHFRRGTGWNHSLRPQKPEESALTRRATEIENQKIDTSVREDDVTVIGRTTINSITLEAVQSAELPPSQPFGLALLH